MSLVVTNVHGYIAFIMYTRFLMLSHVDGYIATYIAMLSHVHGYIAFIMYTRFLMLSHVD